MRSESGLEKDDLKTDGHVGVEENYRPVSNSEWSSMVWTCAEKG